MTVRTAICAIVDSVDIEDGEAARREAPGERTGQRAQRGHRLRSRGVHAEGSPAAVPGDRGVPGGGLRVRGGEKVDYPDIAIAVCRRVVSGDCERGIILDGAGIGSCIAANKIKGIRAAMCYDMRTVINSREHNNANVLTLGGPLHDAGQLADMAKTWLQTRFGGGAPPGESEQDHGNRAR